MGYFPSEEAWGFGECYVHFYTSNNPSLSRLKIFFSVIDSLGISVEQREDLNAPIHLQEIITAIDTLKARKALGPDGFTTEFYKAFKLILAPRLYKVLISGFDLMKVPSSWQEVFVALVPKYGKDLRFPQPYRPISLLNIDYKILMTILAARMMIVLQRFIHPDQSGFLMHRNLKQ